jgi:hypothetical protein
VKGYPVRDGCGKRKRRPRRVPGAPRSREDASDYFFAAAGFGGCVWSIEVKTANFAAIDGSAFTE